MSLLPIDFLDSWIKRQLGTRGSSRSRPKRGALRIEQLEERLLLSTIQNFEDPGTAFVSAQYGTPPGTTVQSGGPTGNFLTLATTNVVSVNSITAPLTDAGSFYEIVADFDIRITPGLGRADGIGFAMLNTADAEYRTAATVGGGSEEPNFRQSLAFGFDINQGPGEISNNHISVHYNESKLLEVDVTPFGIDLASGQFIHAQIIIHPGSTPNGGDVTVTLTPSGAPPVAVLDHYTVTGLFPYEARVHFMARSGGQSATHDIDSILVDFRNPVAGTISLVSAAYTVVEAQPAVMLTVVRTGGSQGTASVKYSTSNGTALSGSDYTESTNVMLNFANGEVSKTISIPILNDAVPEADETFQVTIDSPSAGAALGSVSTATVTIFDVDDDIPQQVGRWENVIPWPVVSIHEVLLPNGKVLFWARHSDTSDGMPHLYDPVTGSFSDTPELDYDIFCAGHALLPDGRVLVAGGHIADGVGEKRASIYDPFTNTWSAVADMNAGRWYPTLTVLPSGDVLVMAGTIQPGQTNALSQVFQVSTGTWRNLTDAPLGNYPEWPDFYPWASVAPNGKVFVAGPAQTARYLDTSGTGSWSDVADSSLSYRDYGSSVTYADGKILIVGGNPREDANPALILPSSTTEVIDLNAATPAWRTVSPMSTGRRHLNTAVLPDGTVLATGGSSAPGFQEPTGAVLYAELWNPTTETWTTMANYSNFQGYHSNALLLPSGQVLMTGGGQPAPVNGSDQKNAQIYSPPYLFTGQRPTIVSEPTTVSYGQPFIIETPNADDIAKVSMIPLGAPTHAFNQNQRFNSLNFTPTAGALNVEAPSGPNLAPPGFYMLFIINGAGVPSAAQIIQVTDDLAPRVTLSVAPAMLVEAAGTTTVTATLSAASSVDVTVNLSFSGTATNVSDYTPSATQIVITAGNTSGTVTLTAAQDMLAETNETIVVDINGVINGIESDTQRITASITDDDHSPAFTSPATANVPENTTAVLTATATDDDLPAQTVTFSLTGGSDQSKFAITSAGVLTFLTAPDFENPTDANTDNVYLVQVTASDGAGGTTTQNLAVTVNNVNEDPSLTANQIFLIAENSPANTLVDNVAATDPDFGDTVTYTIIGGNTSGAFAIDLAMGAITVASPAVLDFETTPTYTLAVLVADNHGATATANVVVNLTNVSEGPQLTLGGPAVTWIKKQPPVTVLPQVAVAGEANLTGGTLTVSVNAISTLKKRLDQFRIASSSGLGNSAGPQFANGHLTLQIQLGDSATTDAIQSFLRGIAFSTKSKGLKVLTRTMSVTLADAGGLSSTVTQTINVRKKA